jgi:hypothetical protein
LQQLAQGSTKAIDAHQAERIAIASIIEQRP